MIHRCRLSIAAGGGICSLNDARKCFAAGADKIIVKTHAVQNPDLVAGLAAELGSQSVMVPIDVEIEAGYYQVRTFSGQRRATETLDDLLVQFVENGAGEIMLTSIDREGHYLALASTSTDL
jgi:cyclase